MGANVSKLESPARSADEYRARIPRRIAALIAGKEREVESALNAGDAAKLETIADQVNSLRIEGSPVGADEVDISSAATLAEMSVAGQPAGPDARRLVRDDLLAGGLVAEFFFAGAATRFSKVSEGPLYFLDAWKVTERVLAAGGPEVPAFAAGLAPEAYRQIQERIRDAAGRCPPARRLGIPLGPRILLGYRTGLERIAREAGSDPAAVVARARCVIHVPESEDGTRILADLVGRRFAGFDPSNVLVIPQPCFGGFTVKAGTVMPVPGSREFPYGHGYSTMQLVQPGAGRTFKDGAWLPIEADVLGHLSRSGLPFLVRTHRVNDLTQLTAQSLDLDRLAAARSLTRLGHRVVIELVANPGGQKGGNWVHRRAGEHRFLVEGMNAKAGSWPDFLERHRGAPYNAFRNMYDGAGLWNILMSNALPDHLRIRKIPTPPGVALYLESVTGDITQIPSARAAAFRRDDREEIHDIKELKDIPDAVGFVAAQDQDESFRRAAN